MIKSGIDALLAFIYLNCFKRASLLQFESSTAEAYSIDMLDFFANILCESL